MQVTPSTTALDNATGLLLRQVAPAAAGLALFVAALTWWLVGRALRPVAAIRREFTEITERDLHRRVPVPRARDEIHRLARTMNATLDRLHRAMTRQRQFVADASHELRSPIAVLRAQLELLLARPSRTDWPTAVHKALQDTERLQAVASDLLLLARLDAQEAPPTAAVDLTALAVEEVRRHPGHGHPGGEPGRGRRHRQPGPALPAAHQPHRQRPSACPYHRLGRRPGRGRHGRADRGRRRDRDPRGRP